MRNLLNIDDQVKVVLRGEGKEKVIGNGEIVTITNIDKFPDGTIKYIGNFHYNCHEGGAGYDTSIQFNEGEYEIIGSETKVRNINQKENKQLSFGDTLKALKELCKPISDYLKNNYDPYATLVITDSQIKLVKDEIGIPIERDND